MAINKSMQTPIGVPANHWVVSGPINLDIKNKSCMFTLSGYADENAFLDGYNALADRNFMISNSGTYSIVNDEGEETTREDNNFDDFIFSLPVSDIMDGIYQYLLSLDEFSGATEV